MKRARLLLVIPKLACTATFELRHRIEDCPCAPLPGRFLLPLDLRIERQDKSHLRVQRYPPAPVILGKARLTTTYPYVPRNIS